MRDHVERIIDDHSDLIDFLRDQQQPSFLVVVESSFPKVALLAAASDLENEVQQVLIDYYHRITGAREAAVSFVRNKAISRQYHTYFDWGKNSAANKFFALFGEQFKADIKTLQRTDDEFSKSVDSFCKIGDLRNQLVHQNYASFTMENTTAEIREVYLDALRFVARLPDLLDGY